jgi:hypothetical protein
MDTQAMIEEVERVFTPVSKPSGLELSFHKLDCDQCAYLRNDMEIYKDQWLPPQALRYLHGEMSCLSAKGWRWVLPSYLRHCLTADSSHDDLETEFLIYNLGPDLKFQRETIKRLSLLNGEQVNCLVHLLEWCAKHPHWSEYCPEDISKALSFMRTLKIGRRA